MKIKISGTIDSQDIKISGGSGVSVYYKGRKIITEDEFLNIPVGEKFMIKAYYETLSHGWWITIGEFKIIGIE